MPSATSADVLARRSQLILNGDADGFAAGHNIPRDQPGAVAGTILAVATQARG